MEFQPLVLDGQKKMYVFPSLDGKKLLIGSGAGINQVSVENLRKFLQHAENLGVVQPERDTVSFSRQDKISAE